MSDPVSVFGSNKAKEDQVPRTLAEYNQMDASVKEHADHGFRPALETEREGIERLRRLLDRQDSYPDGIDPEVVSAFEEDKPDAD